MSPLQDVLASYRHAAASERKGTYFEDLIRTYLRNGRATAISIPRSGLTANGPNRTGLDARDTGIDLVARTRAPTNCTPSSAKLRAGLPHPEERHRQLLHCVRQTGLQHRIIVARPITGAEHAEEACAISRRRSARSTCTISKTARSTGHATSRQRSREPEGAKSLRPHQRTAHEGRARGPRAQTDRSKLIMACGTGKTFTSLEDCRSARRSRWRVLLSRPSLALLSQALTEWTRERNAAA